MPKPGFQSFTMNQEDYDHFQSLFKDSKDDLRMSGTSHFNGFMLKLLYMGEAVFMNQMRAKECEKNDD